MLIEQLRDKVKAKVKLTGRELLRQQGFFVPPFSMRNKTTR